MQAETHREAEMAEAAERKTEDVVVRVFSLKRKRKRDPHPLLELTLHSHVLSARSSFFAARLSQRWQPNDPVSTDVSPNDTHANLEPFALEIIANASCDAYTYKRCIDLMYVQCEDMISFAAFKGIDDTLGMLRIATELLFQDCMDACMQYLDMLCSWTSDEEASIRSTLSHLQIAQVHPDLARRLMLPQAIAVNEPTLILRRMLVHLLRYSDPNPGDLSAAQTFGDLPPWSPMPSIDPSKPIPESCILRAWNVWMDAIRRLADEAINYYDYCEWSRSDSELTEFERDADLAASKLYCLFDKLLVLRAAGAIVKAHAEDTHLSSALRYLLERGHVSKKLWTLLTHIIQSVVTGRVLLLQAVRLALAKTWLTLCNTNGCVRDTEFFDSMMRLIGSLPAVDKEEFYSDFFRIDDGGNRDLLSSFLPWLEELRKAHTVLGGASSIVLVCSE